MTYALIVIGAIISLITIVGKSRKKEDANRWNPTWLLAFLYILVMVISLLININKQEEDKITETRSIEMSQKVTNVDSILSNQYDTIQKVIKYNELLIENLKIISNQSNKLLEEQKNYSQQTKKLNELAKSELEIKKKEYELDAPNLILMDGKLVEKTDTTSSFEFKIKNNRSRPAYSVKHQTLILIKESNKPVQKLTKITATKEDLIVEPQGSNDYYVRASSDEFKFSISKSTNTEIITLTKFSYFDKGLNKQIGDYKALKSNHPFEKFKFYNGYLNDEIKNILKRERFDYKLPK